MRWRTWTRSIKDNMQDLVSFVETQKMLDELAPEYQKLVADVVPAKTTVGGLQRIIQNLVAERVSVRNLPTILEGIAEASSYTKNPMLITEHVRSRLARQLCDVATNANGVVPLVTLSPQLGAGVFGKPGRRWRGAATGDAAQFPAGIHQRCAQYLREIWPDGRKPGHADIPPASALTCVLSSSDSGRRRW